MLDKERLDIIVYSKLEGLWIKKKYGYHTIKALEPSLATREMFLYLNKKHIKLIPRIDKTIKNMKLDGTFDKITHEAVSLFKTIKNEK